MVFPIAAMIVISKVLVLADRKTTQKCVVLVLIFYRFFLVIFVFSFTRSETIRLLNEVVDEDLAATRRLMVSFGYDSGESPNFTISCANIKGCFNSKDIQMVGITLYGGNFSNLTTLKRHGDVRINGSLKILLQFQPIQVLVGFFFYKISQTA